MTPSTNPSEYQLDASFVPFSPQKRDGSNSKQKGNETKKRLPLITSRDRERWTRLLRPNLHTSKHQESSAAVRTDRSMTLKATKGDIYWWGIRDVHSNYKSFAFSQDNPTHWWKGCNLAVAIWLAGEVHIIPLVVDTENDLSNHTTCNSLRPIIKEEEKCNGSPQEATAIWKSECPTTG